MKNLEQHGCACFVTSQIAGLKTAGAQIWGALTKVVTPQKLFLFVLFQVCLEPLRPEPYAVYYCLSFFPAMQIHVYVCVL